MAEDDGCLGESMRVMGLVGAELILWAFAGHRQIVTVTGGIYNCELLYFGNQLICIAAYARRGIIMT